MQSTLNELYFFINMNNFLTQMKSDVFYGAIKTNDHFYDFEPYSEPYFFFEFIMLSWTFH